MNRITIGWEAMICSFIIGVAAVSISLFNSEDSTTIVAEKLTLNSSDGKFSQNESAVLSRYPPAFTFSETPDEIPSFDTSDVAHKKRYSNYEYGYNVKIPSRLVGFSSPAPLPQHGIGIILSKTPKSYIWIDGSYNALCFESPDAAIDEELEWLKEASEPGIEVIRREKTYLNKLSAIRLTVKYRSRAAKENRVQDLVLAFRPNEIDEPEIIYTISLTASESRYKKDAVNFEKIIKGWRTKAVPR